jgi:hypothetical protein
VYVSELILTTDQNCSDGIDFGNYAVFSGLTADTVTLTFDSLAGITAIGSIQMTGLPEPSTFALLGGLVPLGYVIRRRRM